jgi:hypothetical protein
VYSPNCISTIGELTWCIILYKCGCTKLLELPLYLLNLVLNVFFSNFEIKKKYIYIYIRSSCLIVISTAIRLPSSIRLFYNWTHDWALHFFQLVRDDVEEDCFSDPLYYKLCHPSCDLSELKDIRRCILILLACGKPSLDITILDVLEMLDSNMQVLPQNYLNANMTSVLHGPPVPSSKIIILSYSSHQKKALQCYFVEQKLTAMSGR